MKKKIMIVDDEPDHLFTIKQILEFGNEYEVITAKDATECFELLEKNLIPDLILLDIMMPKTSGWDVFTKLKEESMWKNIRVVFLSAMSDDYSKGFGSMTADGYIEKPYEPDELRKKVAQILSKK